MTLRRTLRTFKSLPATLLRFSPTQVSPSRSLDLGSTPLTWSADSIGQGKERGIQGTAGVPQNRVPPVDEGHCLWVPTTLLEVRKRVALMGEGSIP